MEQSLADGKHRGKDPAGMETAVKMSCTKQKEIEQQENTCPSFFPFLLEIHQKEKAGKQKKEGKVKGSQAIFYSMAVNKNIVHRSKVHLCTVVVWKRHIFLKAGSSVLSTFLFPPLCPVVISRVCFCQVVDADAGPVMPALDRST